MDVENEILIQRELIDQDIYDPFKIEFYINSKGVIYGFNAIGETGFTQYGLDIIAAGVSTLIINTINSVRLLTNEVIKNEVRRNYAKCILPNLRNNKGTKERTVLLQSLRLGIESIQES